MRFIYLYVLSVFVAGSFMACSPVAFNQSQNNCPVNHPCVVGNGLMHTNQDQTFITTNKVDLLIIDDNSGSMQTEQENLGTSNNGFITNLNNSGLDWQIAVTNTDVCTGYHTDVDGANTLCGPPPAQLPPYNNLVYIYGGNTGVGPFGGQFFNPLGQTPIFSDSNIIKKGDSNAATTFYNTIQRNNQIGSGDERAIYAAILAMNRNPTGFFRDNSNLAIIILSDEDERSVGGTVPPGCTVDSCGYAPLTTNDQPQTLLTTFNSANWGTPKTLLFNDIIVKPGDAVCLAQQQAQPPFGTSHYGNTYHQLWQMTSATGGVEGSICDSPIGSFNSVLNGIKGALTQQPTSNVVLLNYIPSAQPVVTINPPGNYNVVWTQGTNKITITPRPADNTTVHVEYDFNPANQ